MSPADAPAGTPANEADSANPLLVEITRGSMVESVHRGAVAVADADGGIVLAVGDVGASIYPRSAVKALQALALVESGAADAFGLSDAELALACSSHNGEPMHVEAARRMLAKAGLDERALACGAQWPRRTRDWTALAASGQEPGPIHNNCSGKHAGMLAVARHRGIATEGYVEPEHGVQKEVRAALEAMTGVALSDGPIGIDGCSIPTYAAPLAAWAAAFARFSRPPESLGASRAAAIARLTSACFAHPEMVAGARRYCTTVMRALPGKAFVKTGAEGVFCAALPSLGLGVAVKCDDGAPRGAEAITSAVLVRLLADEINAGEAEALMTAGCPPILNRRRREVGLIRPAAALATASG